MIENLTEEEWDRVMNVNLKSMFLFSKHVIPTMKKQKSGNILSISSEAGQTGSGSKGGSGPAYSVTKAAIINLTKTLARQLGTYNIRANCIAPGPIGGADPDGTTSTGFPMTEEEIREEFEILLVKRIGTPQDVANTALFLVSEKSSYIDGQTISVSGGKIMH
jgi:3-oxoacyl-[acyl-carrier protein] reductase